MDVKVPETRRYADERDRPVIRRGLIDLHMLARIARSEKIIIVTTVLIFLVAAIAYLHVANKKYAVRMVIAAVSTHSESSSGTLDELSSAVGIDLPTGSNSQFKLLVGTLRSPFAAQAIAVDPDLLKAMFPREWSASEGRWREPPSVVAPVMHWLAAAVGWYIPPWSPPGVARVFDYLKDELKVVPDTKSGAVTLELDSRYPEAAARIMTTLDNAVDERMRQRDLQRSTTDIGYLSERLSQVTVEEYRKALVTNLVEQEKTRMLASAPLPYVSDMLGKPLISARPVAPVPAAVLAAALIIGGLVGLGIARIKYSRR
ncbi:MAG TPA: Wzz/FepE/Etk N-terminal domain-containing protein [Steroidobacteraceae bacterium]|jgi:cell division protein FtsL